MTFRRRRRVFDEAHRSVKRYFADCCDGNRASVHTSISDRRQTPHGLSYPSQGFGWSPRANININGSCSAVNLFAGKFSLMATVCACLISKPTNYELLCMIGQSLVTLGGKKCLKVRKNNGF